MSSILTRTNLLNGLYSSVNYLRNEYAPKLLREGDYVVLKSIIEQIQTLERLYDDVNKLPDGQGVNVDAFRSLITQSLTGGNAFFSFDVDTGFSFFDSAEKAEEHAENRMKVYENAWCDSREWGNVETLCWGVVLGQAKEEIVDDGNYGDATVYQLVSP